MINPPLQPGDRIICYHMQGEIAVPPGTKGTVKSVGRDPFESPNETIIRVNWDNGSQLSLLSTTDYWKHDKDQINEVKEPASYAVFKQNPDFFKYFDWKFLRGFLFLLREAGPVNMFQAAPFLYSGKEWIERYFGEGREDDEKFQKMLSLGDKAKDKMISGTVDYLNNNKIDWDLEDANKMVKKFANQMVQVYMLFPVSDSIRNRNQN